MDIMHQLTNKYYKNPVERHSYLRRNMMGDYSSIKSYFTTDEYVVCSTSRNRNSPEIFVIGTNAGNIKIGSTTLANKIRDRDDVFVDVIEAEGRYNSFIQDITFMPESCSKIAAISSLEFNVFDLERDALSTTYVLGNRNYRCLVTHTNDPNILGVSMRDGSVVFVDTRTRPNVGDVVTQYTNQLYPFDVKNSNQLVSVPERVYSITKKSHNTVTNMAFINSNYFVTGSDNGANGIKCWDLRYLSSKPERSCVVNYNFPREHFGRHFGVSDIKLDEKNSKFYVCCTNSRTYAFDSKTTNNNPLFVLQDTNSSVDISDPFFRKMSVSPHSNSVFIGSSKGNPQVFDLNKYKENMYLPIAKYEISGHSEPICNAQFSNDGKHLISISDHMLRVWEYGWDNCLLDCDLNIVNIQKPIEITQHISTIEKTHRSYNIEFDVKSAKLGYPLATGKKISTPSRAKKGIKRKPNDGHDEEPVIKSKYYPIFNGLERVNSEPTTP